jgi:hypothetical protein
MKRIPAGEGEEATFTPIVQSFIDLAALTPLRDNAEEAESILNNIIVMLRDADKSSSDATVAGANGAISNLMGIIASSDSPTGIVNSALSALSMLLSGNNDNRNHFQGYAGSAAIILKAISDSNDEGLIESGLIVIRHAAAESEPNMQSFYDAGALKVLASVFTDHISNGRVVRALCMAISSMTTADDTKASGASNSMEYAKKLVEDHMVMNKVLKALTIYFNDAVTSAKLAMAISHLAVNDVICKEFQIDGGLDKLLGVIHEHKKNQQVACNGASALIVLGRNDKNKDIIASASNMLVNLLQIHADEGLIVSQALGAIAGCTLRKPDNVDMLIEAGVLHPMVVAMRKHPDNPRVQRWCCIALRNLVSRDQNKEYW